MWRVGVSVKKSKFLRILELLEFPRKIGQTAGSAGLAGHSIGCSIKFETSFIMISWFFNAYPEKKNKKKAVHFFESGIWNLESGFWNIDALKKKIRYSLQSTPTCREFRADHIHN